MATTNQQPQGLPQQSSAQESTRVLIGDRDRSTRESLRDALAQAGVVVIGTVGDARQVVQMSLRLRPHVTILDEGLRGLNIFQATEAITSVAPEVMVLLLSQDGGPEFWRQGMAAGARGHLKKPVPAAEVLSQVEQLSRFTRTRRASYLEQYGDFGTASRSLICVCGARGGVGKSTIATNLGIALAQEYPDRVVLLDMALQFGAVALMLNLRPKRSLVDLVPADGEISPAQMHECVLQHESGLRVLVASLEPEDLGALSVDCLEQVLTILRESFYYLVVDLPPVVDRTTLFFLEQADDIVCITNALDLPTVNETKRLLDTLERLGIPSEKIRLALNRVRHQGPLPLEEVERRLACPVLGRIPDEGDLVQESINRGVPVVLHAPQSTIAKRFQDLASKLAPGTEEGASRLPQDGTRSRHGFLQRMLRPQETRG